MNKITQKCVHIVGSTYINPLDVIKLVACINYTTIYLASGKQYVVALTISKVHEVLHPYGQFIRTHKSHVINMAYVLQQTPNGLLLKNNETIDWSRRRKKGVKEQLRKFAR
ncbi:LytTR family DNA-binding domain-containing protein [Emticicia sp. BO119]|uniref:LytTR family DNA-binding domain-containing protein n=1 Tax=Emticicia sp. BO119 TaxID=2757768 RepID=UPI0015F034DA|nr:LytTR family DNA-binding domain-containing protein [Emticicia sp. BO119]MBA4853236.1 LytTR family transcriptional regulator DNA-binding domain-containing protein [Emticicia sp. BO119]